MDIGAAQFDTEVIQSKQAIAAVFYANTPTCNQFVAQMKRLAVSVNRDTSQLWFKLCLINGDRNANLAAAFTVQRARLPVTIFVYGGTIVDRLNGFVAEDRLEAVLLKYKLYFEETANVSLGGGSKLHPIPTAAQAHLSEATTTDHLRQLITRSLIGADAIPFVPTDVQSGTAQSALPEHQLRDRIEAQEVLKAQIQKAKRQADVEVKRLRGQLGIDLKRISEEELMTSYYTSTAYVNAAVLDALEALYHCRQNVADRNGNGKIAQRLWNEVMQKYTRAAQNADFRRVMALGDLLLLKVSLLRAPEDTLPPESPSSAPIAPVAPHRMSIGTDEGDIALFDNIQRWVAEIDSPESHVDGLGLPTATLEEMLANVRACFLAAKVEAKQQGTKAGPSDAPAASTAPPAAPRAAQRRFELMKRCYVAALQCYPETADTRSYRARLASFLY